MVELPHPEYYEGILQLRTPTQEVVDFVRRKTAKDKKAVIVKEKKAKKGIDVYFSSQKYLRSMGKMLKQRFPGILTISRKLFTVSKITGKRVYRVTVLFRVLPFKRGDVLEVRGETVEIITLDKKILVKNLKTGKKEVYLVEELLRAIY